MVDEELKQHKEQILVPFRFENHEIDGNLEKGLKDDLSGELNNKKDSMEGEFGEVL